METICPAGMRPGAGLSRARFVLPAAAAMSKESVRVELRRCRTIKSLHQALDQTYRQIREAAWTDWNRLFAGQDPDDFSVTVRVSKDQIAEELAGIPRAGFAVVTPPPVNGKLRRRCPA